MEPNNLDLPHLVQVCEGAAPGPWRYANYTIYDHRGDRIATIPEGCHHIANFIATLNPSTVLALLRRLGEAERQNDKYRQWLFELSDAIRDQASSGTGYILMPNGAKYFCGHLGSGELEAP